MATKQIGLGTLVKVDENDDGTSHTTVTIVMDATPPARKRARIGKTSLDDTLATFAAGIEQESEFQFTQYWHPTDTQHASIDTLFGSKAEVEWQVVYPFATPITDEFEGWVSDLEPQQIAVDGMITRRVTIQRTTATTRT